MTSYFDFKVNLVSAALAAAMAALGSPGCATPETGATSGQGGSAAGTGGSGAGGSAGTAGAGGNLGSGGNGGSIINPYFGGSIATDAPVSARPCTNLECYQNWCTRGDCKVTACAGGGTTSVSGTIYDPAGKVPLYNIIVYVPNAPVDAISTGASCDKCGNISGSPIASAITDARGQFRLDNVPVKQDIPLVIQVGKWRRQITIPSVASCADTPLTDANLMRLPRSQAEGDLPKIALTTGSADALECLLRKVGIADSEFTPASGPGASGRVNFFAGTGGTSRYAMNMNAGATFPNATALWGVGDAGTDNLRPYDVVLLSCEGTANPNNKSPEARQAMLDYLNLGGRVFASHWHNYWLERGAAPLPTVATFNHLADLVDPLTTQIDTSFPKGAALADWLVNVNGSTTRGQLVIHAGQHTVVGINSAVAQRWIYSDTATNLDGSTAVDPHSIQYLTTNTPVGAAPEAQCGRLVFSDIHVSNIGTQSGGDAAPSSDRSGSGYRFPTGCVTTDLSPQEKALEFMLFDLSSCIRNDSAPPEPPPIIR